MKRHLFALVAGTALTLASVISIARGEDVTAGAVLEHYGDVAEAMYGDAAAAAADLGKAIDALIADPSDKTLAQARAAWKEARPWYQQTEGYRFGNAVVEAGETLRPHRLCGYLYDLATAFTAFFEACPVLKAPDDATRDSRLALCAATARVLARGLDLLGIAAPQRM